MFHYNAGNTYTQNQLCFEPANDYGWFDPGQILLAELSQLQYGKTYYYSFGDPQVKMSPVPALSNLLLFFFMYTYAYVY